MAGETDAVLALNADGIFDICIDENGDIETDDFFDTSLLYSILGEKRALESEVVEPQRRRGWIGNEGKDFENGSKLWLFEQARLLQSNLNSIKDAARLSLQWLIDDDFAVSIDEVETSIKDGALELNITIRRTRSLVVRRFFKLWENTGIRKKEKPIADIVAPEPEPEPFLATFDSTVTKFDSTSITWDATI